jgi:hypothetical protein
VCDSNDWLNSLILYCPRCLVNSSANLLLALFNRLVLILFTKEYCTGSSTSLKKDVMIIFLFFFCLVGIGFRLLSVLACTDRHAITQWSMRSAADPHSRRNGVWGGKNCVSMLQSADKICIIGFAPKKYPIYTEQFLELYAFESNQNSTAVGYKVI